MKATEIGPVSSKISQHTVAHLVLELEPRISFGL